MSILQDGGKVQVEVLKNERRMVREEWERVGREEYRRSRDGGAEGTCVSGVEVSGRVGGDEWVSVLLTSARFCSGLSDHEEQEYTLGDLSFPRFLKHTWQCPIFRFSDSVIAVQRLSLHLPVLDDE